ncbi:putative mediator of RNA polymerase II transcription subunit 26 [Belonocnema kinseyi]|uniref:putative mediator of RNA polymerase II transcription subunit 26 n=1 Tax=Belonocnema kinseyi TaxID=2817044 RepID=UPI00143CE044|nr:putative mediator of RNA polymerase II transcription subunit 26 [Belonocnema kinseyi]
MKTSTVIVLFTSVHLITAQLNFEGNPLTEHTDYLAEESHLSTRTARQQNLEKSVNGSSSTNVSSKENHQPGSPQKLYPVYSQDLGRQVLVIQSGSKGLENSELVHNTKLNQNSGSIQNSEPVQNTSSIQIIEPESEKRPRQLQDNFINTNAIQQEQIYEQQRINPADLALQMFLNSKSPKESEVALSYYLQGGHGLAEQLELEKQQKLRQEEQVRQQQIQLEQMRQKQIQEEHMRQKQIQEEQMRQQQIQQEQMRLQQIQQEQMRQQQIQQEQMRQQQIQGQQMRQKQIVQIQQEYPQRQPIQQQRTQPLQHLEQQNPIQNQLIRQQNLQPQIQENQQVQIQNQPQADQQVQLQNQQIQPQQPVDPLVQPLAPQGLGAYPYPRIPFLQPRTDFYPGAPMYRRPMRRHSYRQPVPLQSRIGPPIYKGVPPPPVYPGKIIKSPMEVIYSRSPAYARGAPVFSGPPGQYEDASPWFAESDHQPPAKDVYYSQLYAQSYDPHYYNYIAKTGKIKPHLYGKLNPEANQDEGILAELFRGFKNHGIKNIMNPTFLLGMTIPALTFMLTALVQKRALSRSDSRSLDQEEIREYLERLQRALECHRKSKGVPTDEWCRQ